MKCNNFVPFIGRHEASCIKAEAFCITSEVKYGLCNTMILEHV